MRRNDQLVAGLEEAELGRHFQRRATVHGGEAGALGHALVLRELAFKGAHVSPLGQRIRVAHGLNDHSDFFFRIADGASAEIDLDIHFAPS